MYEGAGRGDSSFKGKGRAPNMSRFATRINKCRNRALANLATFRAVQPPCKPPCIAWQKRATEIIERLVQEMESLDQFYFIINNLPENDFRNGRVITGTFSYYVMQTLEQYGLYTAAHSITVFNNETKKVEDVYHFMVCHYTLSANED
jgi:hypothetical protein